MKENALKFLYALDCYFLYVLSGVAASLTVVAYYSFAAAKNIGDLGAQVDASFFFEYISGVLAGKEPLILLISYILVLIVSILVFRFKRIGLASYTGLSYCRPISIIASLFLGAILNLLISSFVPFSSSETVEITTILVLCVIIGPFVEELMFRGILLKMFGASVGVCFSILITSALFAVSHGNLIQASYTLVLGLVLGLVRYKSTSLWSAIVLHTSFNVAGTLLSLVSFAFSITEKAVLLALAVIALILSCSGGRKSRKSNTSRN